jgi:hypothetical protein
MLLVFILMALLIPTGSDAWQAQEEKPVKIPKEVASLMEANLPTRADGIDIPLTYMKTLYFPYQNDYYTVFILKIKNQDLNYISPFAAEEAEKQEKEEEIPEEEQILSCNMDFFFRLYSLGENGQITGVHKEIYLPYADQAVAQAFKPEEENIYAFGTIFPPGRYLLCAAAANLDLTKIGLTFREINLPHSSDFDKKLDLTPLFFVKSIKRMPSPDTSIFLYKNLFHYATLEIEPLLDHAFSPDEKLDILYFILGIKPGADGKFKFEVSYTYKQGEEAVLKFEPRVEEVPAPIVSVPLGLSFQEKKLDPGEYTLEITIKDQNSKKEGIKNINFIVK